MTSPFAAALIAGPPRTGTVLGHGYIRVGDDVLAVTPPGSVRMPNGIEASVELAAGEKVTVGGGVLRTATDVIAPGPLWNPRPLVRFSVGVEPRPVIDLHALAGSGPGLTPLGDDVLIGYVAALALTGWDAAIAAEIAGRRTTALSRTLLRLAAGGELPEPAHALLERGDPGPLLAFGSTSGTGIALGLGLARGADGEAEAERVALTLPLQDGEVRFALVVRRRGADTRRERQSSVVGRSGIVCVPDALSRAADDARVVARR